MLAKAFFVCLIFAVNGENFTKSCETDDVEKSTGGGSYFTGFNGAKITNVINSLSVGPRGPILLYDNILLEKLSHFVRERIPERAPGGRGSGAFGYFKCTNPKASSFTKASIFGQLGKITPLVARFGVVMSNLGSPETVRKPMYFSLKMYTDTGNWDLLTMNSEVFSVRDPIRFVDADHSLGLNPKNNLKDYNMEFDYLSLIPETLNQKTWLYSDEGLVDGWRKMNSYSLNTFKFVNKKGAHVYVRFRLETKQGEKYLDDEIAAKIRGVMPDYNSRDLYNAIKRSDYPQWDLQAQILEPEDVQRLSFNPFDPTKYWDPVKIKPIVLGVVVLDKNPTNWFAQIEQLALNPANLVPGIDFALDKVLLGRMFSYRDAQNYRLGANHFKIKVNRPKVSYTNPTTRDGYCADCENGGFEPNYYPNTFGKTRDSSDNNMMPMLVSKPEEIKRFHTEDEDNYSQVDERWRSYDKEQKKRLVKRFAKDLAQAEKMIQDRVLKHVKRANEEYFSMLKEALENQGKQYSRYTNSTDLDLLITELLF